MGQLEVSCEARVAGKIAPGLRGLRVWPPLKPERHTVTAVGMRKLAVLNLDWLMKQGNSQLSFCSLINNTCRVVTVVFDLYPYFFISLYMKWPFDHFLRLHWPDQRSSVWVHMNFISASPEALRNCRNKYTIISKPKTETLIIRKIHCFKIFLTCHCSQRNCACVCVCVLHFDPEFIPFSVNWYSSHVFFFSADVLFVCHIFFTCFMCTCLDAHSLVFSSSVLPKMLLRLREVREEQEVTASAWCAVGSDKHLMLHSHDETSFVLSAVGCAHYSSHFISAHSVPLIVVWGCASAMHACGSVCVCVYRRIM